MTDAPHVGTKYPTLAPLVPASPRNIPAPRVTLHGTPLVLAGLKLTVPQGWSVAEKPTPETVCLIPAGTADRGCASDSVLRVYTFTPMSRDLFESNLEGASLWRDDAYPAQCTGGVVATEALRTASDSEVRARSWTLRCPSGRPNGTTVRWNYAHDVLGMVLHTSRPELIDEADQIVAAADRRGYAPPR